DILAEIETDKATMELESYKDGVLLYQGAKAGEKIQVNDLLAIIGKDGLDVTAIANGLKNGAAAVATTTSAPTPAAAPSTVSAAAPEAA
ncbi:MAG TPA: pyruvate dehydrogenase, partial [Chitinophagaceae bacterium]|nr:pyruvate dehydrogenase [Chitinophagaceae bacterium]